MGRERTASLRPAAARAAVAQAFLEHPRTEVARKIFGSFLLEVALRPSTLSRHPRHRAGYSAVAPMTDSHQCLD